jgi:type II secretion system protein N
MPEFGEVLSVDYWRNRAIVVAYSVAAVVFFILFTIGTFPYDRALTSALVPLGLKVSYNGEHPAFPVGAVLDDVRLINLEQPAAPPLLQSEALKLTPGLGTLIGRPGVGLRADLYGGKARASVRRSNDVTVLIFELSQIDLSRYPVPPQTGATVKGIVSGGGEFEVADRTMNSQKGNLSLDGHDLDVTVIRGFPSLRFATLKGSFQIDRATLRINALDGKGPDMAISASGVIHMGPTVAASMMELTLRITPTVAGRTHLGVLFNFLPHPPDARPYLFHGPLLTPAVS